MAASCTFTLESSFRPLEIDSETLAHRNGIYATRHQRIHEELDKVLNFSIGRMSTAKHDAFLDKLAYLIKQSNIGAWEEYFSASLEAELEPQRPKKKAKRTIAEESPAIKMKRLEGEHAAEIAELEKKYKQRIEECKSQHKNEFERAYAASLNAVRARSPEPPAPAPAPTRPPFAPAATPQSTISPLQQFSTPMTPRCPPIPQHRPGLASPFVSPRGLSRAPWGSPAASTSPRPPPGAAVVVQNNSFFPPGMGRVNSGPGVGGLGLATPPTTPGVWVPLPDGRMTRVPRAEMLVDGRVTVAGRVFPYAQLAAYAARVHGRR
jgi:hypothetical protein